MAYATSIDDMALLERIAQRDESAMTQLYDRYALLLYAVTHRILGCPEDAEEALLDTFCQVWRRPDRHDLGRGGVDAWLVVIARSRALDRLRTRGRDGRAAQALADSGLVETAAPMANLEEAVLLAERRREVRRALHQLPAAQRQVLELAFYGGLSQEAIARHAGEPLGTVKTRVRLGMSKLRTVLGEGFGHPLRRG